MVRTDYGWCYHVPVYEDGKIQRMDRVLPNPDSLQRHQTLTEIVDHVLAMRDLFYQTDMGFISATCAMRFSNTWSVDPSIRFDRAFPHIRSGVKKMVQAFLYESRSLDIEGSFYTPLPPIDTIPRKQRKNPRAMSRCCNPVIISPSSPESSDGFTHAECRISAAEYDAEPGPCESDFFVLVFAVLAVDGFRSSKRNKHKQGFKDAELDPEIGIAELLGSDYFYDHRSDYASLFARSHGSGIMERCISSAEVETLRSDMRDQELDKYAKYNVAPDDMLCKLPMETIVHFPEQKFAFRMYTVRLLRGIFGALFLTRWRFRIASWTQIPPFVIHMFASTHLTSWNEYMCPSGLGFLSPYQDFMPSAGAIVNNLCDSHAAIHYAQTRMHTNVSVPTAEPSSGLLSEPMTRYLTTREDIEKTEFSCDYEYPSPRYVRPHTSNTFHRKMYHSTFMFQPSWEKRHIQFLLAIPDGVWRDTQQEYGSANTQRLMGMWLYMVVRETYMTAHMAAFGADGFNYVWAHAINEWENVGISADNMASSYARQRRYMQEYSLNTVLTSIAANVALLRLIISAPDLVISEFGGNSACFLETLLPFLDLRPIIVACFFYIQEHRLELLHYWWNHHTPLNTHNLHASSDDISNVLPKTYRCAWQPVHAVMLSADRLVSQLINNMLSSDHVSESINVDVVMRAGNDLGEPVAILLLDHVADVALVRRDIISVLIKTKRIATATDPQLGKTIAFVVRDQHSMMLVGTEPFLRWLQQICALYGMLDNMTRPSLLKHSKMQHTVYTSIGNSRHILRALLNPDLATCFVGLQMFAALVTSMPCTSDDFIPITHPEMFKLHYGRIAQYAALVTGHHKPESNRENGTEIAEPEAVYESLKASGEKCVAGFVSNSDTVHASLLAFLWTERAHYMPLTGVVAIYETLINGNDRRGIAPELLILIQDDYTELFEFISSFIMKKRSFERQLAEQNIALSHRDKNMGLEFFYKDRFVCSKTGDVGFMTSATRGDYYHGISSDAINISMLPVDTSTTTVSVPRIGKKANIRSDRAVVFVPNDETDVPLLTSTADNSAKHIIIDEYVESKMLKRKILERTHQQMLVEHAREVAHNDITFSLKRFSAKRRRDARKKAHRALKPSRLFDDDNEEECVRKRGRKAKASEITNLSELIVTEKYSIEQRCIPMHLQLYQLLLDHRIPAAFRSMLASLFSIIPSATHPDTIELATDRMVVVENNTYVHRKAYATTCVTVCSAPPVNDVAVSNIYNLQFESEMRVVPDSDTSTSVVGCMCGPEHTSDDFSTPELVGYISALGSTLQCLEVMAQHPRDASSRFNLQSSDLRTLSIDYTTVLSPLFLRHTLTNEHTMQDSFMVRFISEVKRGVLPERCIGNASDDEYEDDTKSVVSILAAAPEPEPVRRQIRREDREHIRKVEDALGADGWNIRLGSELKTMFLALDNVCEGLPARGDVYSFMVMAENDRCQTFMVNELVQLGLVREDEPVELIADRDDFVGNTDAVVVLKRTETLEEHVRFHGFLREYKRMLYMAEAEEDTEYEDLETEAGEPLEQLCAEYMEKKMFVPI